MKRRTQGGPEVQCALLKESRRWHFRLPWNTKSKGIFERKCHVPDCRVSRIVLDKTTDDNRQSVDIFRPVGHDCVRQTERRTVILPQREEL